MNPYRTTPQVRHNLLEIATDSDHKEQIIVGTDRWFEWLEEHRLFHLLYRVGRFTACKEKQGKGYYWYAYRKINGKKRKKYLGKSEALTAERLYEIAKAF